MWKQGPEEVVQSEVWSLGAQLQRPATNTSSHVSPLEWVPPKNEFASNQADLEEHQGHSDLVTPQPEQAAPVASSSQAGKLPRPGAPDLLREVSLCPSLWQRLLIGFGQDTTKVDMAHITEALQEIINRVTRSRLAVASGRSLGLWTFQFCQKQTNVRDVWNPRTTNDDAFRSFPGVWRGHWHVASHLPEIVETARERPKNK